MARTRMQPEAIASREAAIESEATSEGIVGTPPSPARRSACGRRRCGDRNLLGVYATHRSQDAAFDLHVLDSPVQQISSGDRCGLSRYPPARVACGAALGISTRVLAAQQTPSFSTEALRNASALHGAVSMEDLGS